MADLFDSYDLADSWDETFVAADLTRPSYESILTALRPLGVDELEPRVDALARTFMNRGVTFAYDGQERPFPLDIVPRVIDAAEWDLIDRGVQQRVRTLEAFLADVYGPGQVFADRILPRDLVLTSSHFHRESFGIEPPNGVRIHVSGIDLIRDTEGRFRVLEDNVRIPSGVSYVIENRHALTQVLPEAFASSRVRPVSNYANRLLSALRASAPSGVDDPTVVVLTPGVHNSAYFEHALLARQMGVELVEGRDLFCAGNRVFMPTTAGERPVHVIYRRVDDEYLDPVQFRPDSVLGCPGLVNAARAGHVVLANAIGNGVADDKLIYSFVPDLIRYYTGEDPILPNVETYRLGDPDAREYVLDRLDQLVLKPVDGSGGKGLVIGPQADERTLELLRTKIIADPRAWIAQPVISMSTVPTFVGDAFRPRHVDLRPFAVNDGQRVWVLPGGLTRVALGQGQLVVNSSRGGGSKDTWVLAARGERTVSADLGDLPDDIAEHPTLPQLSDDEVEELRLAQAPLQASPDDAAPRDPGPTGPSSAQQQQQ